MTSRSVDECLFHLPAIVRAAQNDWERGFAASLMRQSRRRNWRPTEKQEALLRRLVDDLFTYGTEECAVLDD